MVFKKAELEASLQEEQELINEGVLKDDSPLDTSLVFKRLCEASRRGDLKGCVEALDEGAHINAKDEFDYTPLILASLCGHFEVVQLLLEAGALCERDTFQGERCLYNALTDRIRNLLLDYTYSKTSDPLQPYAAHVSSLLTRESPQTADITVISADTSFRLHKFILSARSPYFLQKLAASPDAKSWKVPASLPPQSFEIAIRYLYMGDIPPDVGGGPGTGFTEDEILQGVDKISKHLEVQSLWDAILLADDRRRARQRRTEEQEKARSQIEEWFTDNVLQYKVETTVDKAGGVRWDRNNRIFADVLLRADEPPGPGVSEHPMQQVQLPQQETVSAFNGIPIGPGSELGRPDQASRPRRSVLFPAHRAMLLRSEFFATMFSSSFREARDLPFLHIVPIDCSPEVLQIVLKFLYTEKADVPLRLALDLLYVADQLFIEKLKVRAAVVISTLGSGDMAQIPTRLDVKTSSTRVSPSNEKKADELDIYEVIRAGWQLRVPRLEEFGARYIAYRLEAFIDEPDFQDIVKESATRIQAREETDTIELLDDIRYYLSERFRMRFEDSGLEDILDEDQESRARDTAGQDESKSSGNVDGTTESMVDEGIDVPEEDGIVEDGMQDLQQSRPTEDTAKFVALDGTEVDDEIEGEAWNYRILLEKIDRMLEKLKLDA